MKHIKLPHMYSNSAGSFYVCSCGEHVRNDKWAEHVTPKLPTTNGYPDVKAETDGGEK